MKFNADGTAMSEGKAGTWTLAGNTLTAKAEGEPERQMTLARSGDNLVLTVGGQTITATACPAGSETGSAAKSDEAAAEGAEAEGETEQ
jgi:hypothetical protein